MDRERMDALVAAAVSRIGHAWLAMVAHLRADNSVTAIAARIDADAREPVSGVTDAASRLATGFHAAYVAAGQATAKWLGSQVAKPIVAKKESVFDPLDPPAVRWAERNRLELIREIDSDTRQMIHDALVEAARTGVNPNVVARQIRDSIGLTQYQSGIVDSYRRSLEGGQYADALTRELSSGHSDKTIAAALRNETRLTQQQIDTAVERYRVNWQLYRAETIARTEGLRVAHQAGEELYRQAIERGDLQASQLERTWHHGLPGKTGTKGERTFHRSMDDQVRAFGEPFTSGLGGLLRYPGDPDAGAEETANCRCVITTRLLPAESGAEEQGAGMQDSSGAETSSTDDSAPEEEPAVEEEPVTDEEQTAAETDQIAEEEEPDAAEPEPSIDELPDVEIDADAVLDDMASDRLDAARDKLEESFLARGFQPQEQIGERPPVSVLISDDGLTVTTHSGKTMHAGGVRHWNGQIQLSVSKADQIKAFVRVGSDEANAAVANARIRAADFAQQRAELQAKYPRSRRSKEVIARLKDLYEQQIHASADLIKIRTVQYAPSFLVHETLHGFSPVAPVAYRGAAGQIEEVTTEIVSRFVSRDAFGIPLDNFDLGAYANDVRAVVEAVTAATGRPLDVAYLDVHDAAIAFKSRIARLGTVDEVVSAFAEDLAAASGGDRLAVEESLRGHLAAVNQ